MALTQEQLDELLQVIKHHIDWALLALIGPQAITEADLEELKAYGLPATVSVSMIENAYVLGILKAILKKGEWQELTFDELLQEAVRTHTPIEALAIQQAEIRAGEYLKNLLHDIAHGAYQTLADVQNDIVTEATIKDIVRDRAKLALLERKSYQKFAADLAHSLQTDWRRDWRRVAETELHSAKTQGQAQAIAHKIDVYSDSDGVQSNVSVVPAPDACEDCKKLYLDEDGNPRVFVLKDLMDAGSNGEPGVSHKREKGLHIHWKTTLPPLHPRCGCSLTYVPPGFGWKDKKMVVVNKEKYKEYLGLSKSLLEKGDKAYSPFSPTAAPMGPKGSLKNDPPKPPSLPNLPSPSQMGTGTAKQGTTPKATPAHSSQPHVEWEYWSGTGNPNPEDGWERSPSGRSWRRPKGTGKIRSAKPDTNPQFQHPQYDPAQARAEAHEWSKKEKSHAELADHLSKGEFAVMDNLGHNNHVNEAYKVAIAGNGNALFKPTKGTTALNLRDGVVPHDGGHHREAAASHFDAMWGVGIVPTTVVREHQGREGSLQAWKEHTVALQDAMEIPDDYEGTDKHFNVSANMVSKHPELKEQFERMIVFDIVTNNTDRHDGNVLIADNEDGSKKAVGIDHELSFGNGMKGYRNWVHRDLHKAGHKVKIPDDLRTRLDNTTFGDMQRAAGKLDGWAVAQSYLRAQYVLHLQDTEGELKYEHFVHGLPTSDGGWGADDADAFMKQFRSKDGLTHQRFDNFAKQWLATASSDPNHPKHEDAKMILDMNPFYEDHEIKTNGVFRTTKESLKDADLDKTPVRRPRKQAPQDDPGKTPVRRPRRQVSDPDKTPIQRPQKHDPFESAGKPHIVQNNSEHFTLSDPFGSAGKPIASR